ncbi:recombinase RecT [Paenibacillus agaridevorans]|uniref:recombinase RecT n=1 Tax=Paenibacillus agaridevorans TaxID=171404 RepID=UPI001BE40343|nr:recombinase RecT [Paenibacillus agaridevorans]
MTEKTVTSQSNLSAALANKAAAGTEVGVTVKSLLDSPGVKKRFEEVLKNRAPQYMTSIINLYNSENSLKNCDPMSVVASAMVAASLDLPVDKNLGYAWVVPYKNRASFQLGYKGYIQLALRTGQYRFINAVQVYEGELVKWDRLTEELQLDESKRTSDKIVGYCGYFELLNGFKKTVYWTKEQIEIHKKRFSKSDFGWNKDWDAMALKTVIRNMLSKWGILSVEMQTAYSKDLETKVEYGQEDEDGVIEADFSIIYDEHE